MGFTQRRPNTDPPQSEARVRASLVQTLSAESGVEDGRILDAFARVPRHLFVPSNEHDSAYNDVALPIGFKQTISQPSMIAIMLAALQIKPGDRVLEVGGGSGYAAALLAELGAAEVYTIEILPELAARAEAALANLGYSQVHVLNRNGRHGLPEHAPYDAILVSAGAEGVPHELERELALGGRIAIPVGDLEEQQLLVGHKTSQGEMTWERSVPCIFVPLVGTD
ncbi:MAG: protein-L-isoaspartate(D-aspartate) O-methyltransferase [Myxococcota bacterium]